MTVRATLRGFLPRLRVCETPTRDLIVSIRWFDAGWDHIRAKGYRLTQWGRRGKLPLRFICRCPKENPTLPEFLYSSKWKPTFTKRGLVVGTTHKPFDVGTFWRTLDERFANRSIVKV